MRQLNSKLYWEDLVEQLFGSKFFFTIETIRIKQWHCCFTHGNGYTLTVQAEYSYTDPAKLPQTLLSKTVVIPLGMSWTHTFIRILERSLPTQNIKWWHVSITETLLLTTSHSYSCVVTCHWETIPHFVLAQRNTGKLPGLHRCTSSTLAQQKHSLHNLIRLLMFSYLFVWEKGSGRGLG